MLQDLREISVLGKGNPAPLIAINFDMTLLDTAAHMAEKLGKLWAETKTDRTAASSTGGISTKGETRHICQALGARPPICPGL